MPDRRQQAIPVLQPRFGSAAPRRAAPPCPARPTGIPELDALTGIGGGPGGRVSLLAGPPGSGKRTPAPRRIPPPPPPGAGAPAPHPRPLAPAIPRPLHARRRPPLG